MLVCRGGRLFASTLTAFVITFAVTGCGTQNGGDLDQALPAEQETSSSPEVEPTEPPTSESKSPDSTEAEPPDEKPVDPAVAAPIAPGIRGKLLTAEEVPGFNKEFSWAVQTTRMHEGKQPFGTCHKFAMTSIGAEQVAVRSYTPTAESSGAAASHLVAEFADEMTAKRAFEVLKSWAGQCDEELREYPRSETGKLKPVSVEAEGGFAHWYLLTYGPIAGNPDAGFFDAQGLTRVGRTISALEMKLIGQDYNYRSGEEPMVAAVQNAAIRLG